MYFSYLIEKHFYTNKYFSLNYDNINDLIIINDVTIIYYLLYFLNLRNNKIANSFIELIFSIKLNNIIKKTIDNKFLLENDFNLCQIYKYYEIVNIRIDIKNHRYSLDKLREKICFIDKNIPIIFCIAYFEKILKIKNCNITICFRKNVNKCLNIKYNDTLSYVINI